VLRRFEHAGVNALRLRRIRQLRVKLGELIECPVLFSGSAGWWTVGAGDHLRGGATRRAAPTLSRTVAACQPASGRHDKLFRLTLLYERGGARRGGCRPPRQLVGGCWPARVGLPNGRVTRARCQSRGSGYRKVRLQVGQRPFGGRCRSWGGPMRDVLRDRSLRRELRGQRGHSRLLGTDAGAS